MPTYEYVCRACGHQFERFQPITAAPIKTCPTCGKPKVERKIGIGAGVLFKGGGFYETDYRSEQYTKAAKAEHDAAKPAAEKPKGEAAPQGPSPSPSSSPASKKGAEGKATSEREKSAEPDRTSKATHPSRVGRGIGNIVERPTAPAKSAPRKKRRA